MEQFFVESHVLPPALLTRLYVARTGFLVAGVLAFLPRFEECLTPQQHLRSVIDDVLTVVGSLADVFLIFKKNGGKLLHEDLYQD